jgi:glycosyltransferase involved in cell wall biosynthesis
MTDDELEILPIAPLAEGVPRSRWSVMIPTYNAARTIAETLQSVLAQAPAEGEMQIAVVDNASTDETLTVVERTIAAQDARDRVEIHRNASNLGMVGNWNACIELARGELVHILHADDLVRPGFYAAVEERLQQHPEAEICVARVFVIGMQGELERMTDRLARSGELTVFDVAYENHCYPPGIVVRRAGYERVGGFSNVISYLPDWEMCMRLLQHRNGVFINEPLACYRQTPGNATDHFSKTTNDLRDLMRFGDVIARRVPKFSRGLWRRNIRRHAAWGMNKWQVEGDDAAYRANQAVWRKLASSGEKLDDLLAVAKEFGKKCERSLRNAIWRGRFLAAARELGRRFERSMRYAIWRRKKK